MFENYKDCLLIDKNILKLQQRFKSDRHEVYMIKDCNSDKRLPTFNRVKTYPYGANAFKLFKSEILKVCEAKERLKMLSEKIRICKAKMKLEMLSKECKIEMFLKEKEKFEMFLRHVKVKCKSKTRKYIKLKVKNAK